MENKTKQTLIIIGIGVAAYLLFKKSKPSVMVEQGQEIADKKNLPSVGGGGGGFRPLPTPTLAVPTSQVIVQTQPTPSATTSNTSSATVPKVTAETQVNPTKAASSGMTIKNDSSVAPSTSSPAPVPSPAPPPSSTVKFMDFFNVDADGQDVIESIL